MTLMLPQVFFKDDPRFDIYPLLSANQRVGLATPSEHARVPSEGRAWVLTLLEGLGFRVYGLGSRFWVLGLGFGFRFWVQGIGFGLTVKGLGLGL